MIELLVDKIDATALVMVLVLFVFWVMDWIKRVLKDKLREIYIQPVALVTGTLVSAFILYAYDYRPIDLGMARFLFVDFVVQGGLLAALAGTFYDKFMK